MPRPCYLDHPPSPGVCRLCAWCIMPGHDGEINRERWGEPEPTGPRVTVKRRASADKPRVAKGVPL